MGISFRWILVVVLFLFVGCQLTGCAHPRPARRGHRRGIHSVRKSAIPHRARRKH